MMMKSVLPPCWILLLIICCNNDVAAAATTTATAVSSEASSAEEACVSMKLYEGNSDCTGVSKDASFPVGTEQFAHCESHDVDGVGKLSIDWYCQFPQKVFHKNAYFGDTGGDCDKTQAGYVMEETIQTTKKCIGIGPQMSVQYECIAGPCRSDDDNNDDDATASSGSTSIVEGDAKEKDAAFSEMRLKVLLASASAGFPIEQT